MEIYSWKEVTDADGVKHLEPDLPTGEELVNIKNEMTKTDFEEWKKYCSAMLKRFVVPGEPVCTDLSKLFHTKEWRLKEMMYNRSAGPVGSYDKFNQLTQSMFSLVRIRVGTGEFDEYGNEVTENRSLNEAFLGHKKWDIEGDQNEQAIDMGKIKWEQSSMPTELKEFLSGGGVETTGIREEIGNQGEIVQKEWNVDMKAVQDNNEGYFWVMNYLAADDNVTKRPWQFIMKLFERPQDMEQMPWYTDKIKFWQIIWHGPATAWGKWRKRYLDARTSKDNLEMSRQEQVKAAEDKLDSDASASVEKGKLDYMDSVRSHPSYYNQNNQRVSETVWENGRPVNKEISFPAKIEGQASDKPGLAVRFGFMKKKDILQTPRYIEIA